MVIYLVIMSKSTSVAMFNEAKLTFNVSFVVACVCVIYYEHCTFESIYRSIES